MPPATDASRPKICASPCQSTLVPHAFAARSNAATTVTFPPATTPCPWYCARRGRSASANSIFTSALPLIYEIPTFTLSAKCVASCTVNPWKSGSSAANRLGSVRKSYTSSGVFFTSNVPANLIAISGSPHVAGRHFDGLEAIHISGAAASIARDRLANFLFVGLPILRQQLMSREHQTGRAVATLQTVSIAEGFLNRM